MKKVFYFLLVALPILLVSCDNDDDVFPRVKMSLDVSGVTIVDGTAYVVQGDTFKVNDIKYEDGRIVKLCIVNQSKDSKEVFKWEEK